MAYQTSFFDEEMEHLLILQVGCVCKHILKGNIMAMDVQRGPLAPNGFGSLFNLGLFIVSTLFASSVKYII